MDVIELPNVAAPRTRPTGEQRTKLKELVHLHYDGKIHKYIDNMSDQSIADAVGVAVSYVEDYRLIEFGEPPPPPDPIAALHAALAAVAKRGEQERLNIITTTNAARDQAVQTFNQEVQKINKQRDEALDEHMKQYRAELADIARQINELDKRNRRNFG